MYVMRRVSLSLMMLLATLVLYAQGSEGSRSLVFEETEWDFGRIKEVDGVVTHTFRYRNEADHSVSIERVYTSCGCTTGDYSRRPLKAGGEALFTVKFDPAGRGGKVEKTLTLVYDGGKGRTLLVVSGEVEARPRTVAEDYPYDFGSGIRCNLNYRAFGNVAEGGSVSMTFGLANTSEEVVQIGTLWGEESGAMELFLPEALGPGERALATMTYQPSRGEEMRYGLLRDRFRLTFNGVEATEEIVTTAIGVDDMKPSRRAPKAEITPIYHNFQEVKVGELCSVEVTITNSGKEDLVIRSVAPREFCTIDLREGEVIPRGESITRVMTLRAEYVGYGTLYGGVMIVLNDPERPVRELRVAAEVQ